jgi:hypothetical protein
MRLAAMGLALLLGGTTFADDEKGKAPDKTAKPADAKSKPADTSPAGRIKAIMGEYNTAYNEFYAEYRKAKTNEERQKTMSKYPQSDGYAAKLLQVVKDAPKDPAAFGAIQWVIQRGGGAQGEALEILRRDHFANEKIGDLCPSLANSRNPAAVELVRQVLEKNPSRDAKGKACYALASHFKNDAAHQKEAESLLDRTVKEYADVKYFNRALGDLAKGDLFEIRELAIGKVAPEIIGDDLNGSPMKLSDYRGKVVVLDFWGNW